MNPPDLDLVARAKIAAQRRRRLMSIGIAMVELLRELEELEAAHVPEDQRGGLTNGLFRLSNLCSAKAQSLLSHTLSSTPARAGQAAVSPRGAGQPQSPKPMKDVQKQIDRAELRTLKKNRKKVKSDLSALEKDCRSEMRRAERLIALGRERARRLFAEIDTRAAILEGRLN